MNAFIMLDDDCEDFMYSGWLMCYPDYIVLLGIDFYTSCVECKLKEDNLESINLNPSSTGNQ